MTEDIFAHWNTEPETIKQSYQPEGYTPSEWAIRKMVERSGDPMWEHAGTEATSLEDVCSGAVKDM